MSKKQSSWMFGTPRSKPTRGGVPEAVKAEVSTKANDLIETVLKPQHIQPPPDHPQFNYIVDIFGKWYRRSFYLCATYCVPGPHAAVPHFEVKFARMEYSGSQAFHLAFLRHTGQWVELYTNLSVDDCFAAIRDEQS